MTGRNYENESAASDSGTAILVIFTLDGRLFAIPLGAVIRVERVAEVTPVPQTPSIVLGIIDFHGEIIPVVDIRQRFGIPSRPVELSDQFLFVKTRMRFIAFLVDNVEGMVDATVQRPIEAGSVLAGLEHIRGILPLENGLVLIHDPETFLSLEEETSLEKALRELPGKKGHTEAAPAEQEPQPDHTG